MDSQYQKLNKRLEALQGLKPYINDDKETHIPYTTSKRHTNRTRLGTIEHLELRIWLRPETLY